VDEKRVSETLGLVVGGEGVVDRRDGRGEEEGEDEGDDEVAGNEDMDLRIVQVGHKYPCRRDGTRIVVVGKQDRREGETHEDCVQNADEGEPPSNAVNSIVGVVEELVDDVSEKEEVAVCANGGTVSSAVPTTPSILRYAPRGEGILT
jgi:hypothetical protein